MPDRSVPGFPATQHPPDKAACAPFFKEGRMMFANATNFYRKSGVAKWRDLRFLPSPVEQRAHDPTDHSAFGPLSGLRRHVLHQLVSQLRDGEGL